MYVCLDKAFQVLSIIDFHLHILCIRMQIFKSIYLILLCA